MNNSTAPGIGARIVPLVGHAENKVTVICF